MADIFAVIQVRVPTGSPYREMTRVNQDTAAFHAAVETFREQLEKIHAGSSVTVVRQRLAQSPKPGQPTLAGGDTGTGGDSQAGSADPPAAEPPPDFADAPAGTQPLPSSALPSGADTLGQGRAEERLDDPGARGPAKRAGRGA